jgi:HPr kinase/phosphorylase
MDDAASVHASAVLVGARAVLIRGPSGAGKSRLALALVAAAESGLLRFARLVGDDRLHLHAAHGRLLARPVDTLAGLIEVRGLGIRTLAYEPSAVVGLVVDLAVADAERLPPAESTATIAGVRLPQLALPPAAEPVAPVLAALRLEAANQGHRRA